MSNELNRHKKSDKIKWLATGLAGILLAGACATTLAMGITQNGWFEKETEQVTPDEQPPAEEQTDVVVSAGESNGIMLASTQLSKEEYADYGISTMAETAYQLKASLTPTTATNKLLDWSVAWKNANSTWAKGKTVTDYVTITPTSDGAVTATLAFKQQFSEQIIVTCSSRHNPEVKATCTVDCTQKVLTTSYFRNAGISNNMPLDGTTDSQFVTSSLNIAVTSQLTSAYTISDSFTTTVQLKGVDSLASALIDGGYYGCYEEYSLQSKTLTLTQNQAYKLTFDTDGILYKLYGADTFASSGGWWYQSDSDSCNNYLASKSTTHVATLIVTISGKYSSVTGQYGVYLNGSSITINITDITLNQSGVVF